LGHKQIMKKGDAIIAISTGLARLSLPKRTEN